MYLKILTEFVNTKHYVAAFCTLNDVIHVKAGTQSLNYGRFAKHEVGHFSLFCRNRTFERALLAYRFIACSIFSAFFLYLSCGAFRNDYS